MNAKIYEMVTERILKQLEAGVVPWRKPWNFYGTVSWKTQKPYRGVNALLLDPGEYATFLQIKEAGGRVRYGEKSQMVVFWDFIPEKDKDGELTDKKRPLLMYHNVFEINRQVEGLDSRRKQDVFVHESIEEAERIVQNFIGAPRIVHAPNKAVYKPREDVIYTPPMRDYAVPEEYYSTLFHELIHSTGAANRLNRSGITEFNGFGSEQYSKEELIAEMGASMLCGVAGIVNQTIDNNSAYIAGWLGKLRHEKTWIIQAAGQAQKAADYILGARVEEQEGESNGGHSDAA